MVIQLCWQCGKQLQSSFAVIDFNGSQIKVHKICRKDAENLLLRNKVTFAGQESALERGKDDPL